MKNKNILVYLMLAFMPAATFTACSDSKDDVPQENTSAERIPVVLSGKVYSMESADGTVLRSGEKFGVFMLESGTDTPVEGYANVLHTADDYSATGYLVPVGEPMYYPTDGRKVDIVAYFPYQEDVTAASLNLANATRADNHSGYIYQMNLKNQQTAKVDDFLHAPQETGHSKNHTKVNLALQPVVARIQMTLEPGADMTTEKLSKLLPSLSNMPTVANFDLIHGTFLELLEKENMEMKKTTNPSTGSLSVSALIFPGAIEEEADLVLKDPEKPETEMHLTLSLKEVLEHAEENTEYQIHAKVTPQGIEAELVGSSPIYVEDWQNDTPISDNIGNNPTELVTNGTFENLTADNFKTGTGVAKTDHTWYAVKNGTDVEGEAVLTTDKTQGNVLSMKFSGSGMNWYRNYIGHTMSGATRNAYHLQFKARAATKGAKLQVYVKVNKSGNYFFVLNKANTQKACAARTISLTEEWKTYTIDFDLTKVVNTINTPKVATDGTLPIVDSTKEDLANFFAAFAATTDGATYYIDDVTMIEIEK
jgi:hypothetical protein